MKPSRDHKDIFRKPSRRELIYYIYNVLRPKDGKKLLIGFAFFLVGFIGLLFRIHQFNEFNLVSFSLLVLAVLGAIFTAINYVSHIYKSENIVIETDSRAEKLIENINGVTKVPGSDGEFFLVEPDICRWLLNTPKITIKLSENNHSALRKMIRANADHLEKYLRLSFNNSLKKGKQFSDDKKVCLSEDFEKDRESIACHIGSYFDSYCTNEYCTKLLRTDEAHPERVASGLDIFPVTGNILKPISISSMNNHIGISTLAITSDGYIRLWRQGNKNQISEGKVVATGSGSLDAEDIAPSFDFMETVRTGMEREFREESSRMGYEFDTEPVLETRITGYFRWVKRGGKPEFVGVTRLRVPLSMLEPNAAEVDAPNFGDLVFPARNWHELSSGLHHIMNTHSHFSPSCWVALLCLKEVVGTQLQEWETFLFSKHSSQQESSDQVP